MTLLVERVQDGYDVYGKDNIAYKSVTLDDDYPEGGYTLRGSHFGFGNKPLKAVLPVGGNSEASRFRFFYDLENQKLIVSESLGEGVTVYSQGDIKGSANTDVPIASGTLPTNGALLSTLAAANNTTPFTIALQPDIARNVMIAFKNTNAGASTGNAVDVVIEGFFRGEPQTETISFTALELTSTAQNEVAAKYGSKPFDTITSITPSAAQPANWQHGAGPGSKLGLPQIPNPNAEDAILKLTKNGANLSPTGTYSATNTTINFGALSDGDDVAATYTSGGQIADGTDLSEVTVQLLGIQA